MTAVPPDTTPVPPAPVPVPVSTAASTPLALPVPSASAAPAVASALAAVPSGLSTSEGKIAAMVISIITVGTVVFDIIAGLNGVDVKVLGAADSVSAALLGFVSTNYANNRTMLKQSAITGSQ